MEYNIKKIYDHFERRYQFSYAAIKVEKLRACETGLLSPWLSSPEEVVSYMQKKSQECLIDPKTIQTRILTD